MSTTAFNFIAAGHPAQAIVAAFTDTLGGWFYMILGLMIITAIYIKTDSAAATGMAMALLGGTGFFLNIPGIADATNYSMIGIYFLLMVTGLAIPLYSLFSKNK